MGRDPFTGQELYSTGVQTEGRFVTKKFYWGDFSAEPWKFIRDTDNGLLVPAWYINVKVNLIDCGEPYVEQGDANWFSHLRFDPPYRGIEQWPTEY